MSLTYSRELIGEMIQVVHSSQKQLEGLQGKIVDETKSTFTLEQDGKTKKLLKNTITFRLQSSGLIIDGKKLLRRAEERIKGN